MVVEDRDAPETLESSAVPTNHRARVIEILQALTPSAFERFSQRLLREAGFQNVVVTGRSGDGGIDGMGILQVNTLVSFKVLFQCKRYKDTVSPSHVRDFRGAQGSRSKRPKTRASTSSNVAGVSHPWFVDAFPAWVKKARAWPRGAR